jgi:hypothetical protein
MRKGLRIKIKLGDRWLSIHGRVAWALMNLYRAGEEGFPPRPKRQTGFALRSLVPAQLN